MNNFPIPFPPISTNNYYYNFQEEFIALKKKVDELEERVQYLEKSKEQNYLKKEDNYYML